MKLSSQEEWNTLDHKRLLLLLRTFNWPAIYGSSAGRGTPNPVEVGHQSDWVSHLIGIGNLAQTSENGFANGLL